MWVIVIPAVCHVWRTTACMLREQGWYDKVKCCLCLSLALQMFLFPALGEILELSSLLCETNCFFSLASHKHLWVSQQCRTGQTSGHWACLLPSDLHHNSVLLHGASDLAGYEKTVGQIKIQSTCCLLLLISLVCHIIYFFLFLLYLLCPTLSLCTARQLFTCSPFLSISVIIKPLLAESHSFCLKENLCWNIAEFLESILDFC